MLIPSGLSAYATLSFMMMSMSEDVATSPDLQERINDVFMCNDQN